MRRVSSDDLKQAMFGGSDGACDALGIVLTLWVSHHRPAIAIAVLGAGLAAATSMAGSEYIADPESSVHRAATMGLATLTGALWIGLPFFYGHGPGSLAFCVLRVILLGAVVAYMRSRTLGWSKALCRVYTIFTAVAVVTTLAGLLS